MGLRFTKEYASFAAFVASDINKSTQIHPRFERLGARNLLYLEPELAELESRLDTFDAQDLLRSTEAKQAARDFQILNQRAREDDNVEERARLELILQIREKLKEYREAVFLESHILSLDCPSKRSFKAFRATFNNEDSPAGLYPTLGGPGGKIYESCKDLVTISTPRQQENEDRLTAFLRRYLAVLFVTEITDFHLAYISERRLNLVSTIVSTLLAALLLFGPIINLYLVTDARTRLGLIAGYTILFAVCIGLVTKARRSEVFGACAAYAAVLVVFVSGNLGSVH